MPCGCVHPRGQIRQVVVEQAGVDIIDL